MSRVRHRRSPDRGAVIVGVRAERNAALLDDALCDEDVSVHESSRSLDGRTVFEATEEAVQSWIELGKSFGGRTIGDPSCTPGYYNNEGMPVENNPWTGGVLKFAAILQEWRDARAFEGLDVHVS